MNLLLVEDDLVLQGRLLSALRDENYDVTLAPSSAEAQRAGVGALDFAVVTRTLPDGDGLDLCLRLRRKTFDGPILMLSSRGEAKDRVRALDAGVDDYLTKPFDMDELLARLRALGRRSRPAASGTLAAGPLRIDGLRRQVQVGGKPLASLTPTEVDILVYLAREPGRLVPKIELAKHLSNDEDPSLNLVRVAVSRLRDKLGAFQWVVETRRGEGYRLRSEEPHPKDPP